MRLALLSYILVLVAIISPAVLAQPPAETCGAGDSLSGSDLMPQNLGAMASSDDFTLTGTGCNERNSDHVTCFTPTSSCSVQAECSDSTRDLDGLQFSVNAFEGPCTTSPASCLDSSQGTGSSGSITVALTAGTMYCFVCEVDSPGGLGLSLSTAGDCGMLPVELQTFEIE